MELDADLQVHFPEIASDEPPHITVEDRYWLEQLGVEWPSLDQEAQWLTDYNDLVVIGSHDLRDVPASEDEDCLTARQLFFGELLSISQCIEKFSGATRISIPTFIGSQRVLASKGVDIARVTNKHPSIVCLTPDKLSKNIENLDALGINAVAAINRFPQIIDLTPDKLSKNIENLDALGINAVAAINKIPTIIALSSESILDKMINLENLGLDGVSIINIAPQIVTLSTDNIQKKMRLLYSVTRAWGWSDYRVVVNKIVNSFPSILSGKPDKIRVLARVASRTMPPLESKNILISNISTTFMTRLEQTVVAYLESAEEIHEPRDIPRVSSRYKKLGKETLRRVIAAHPSDPVTKKYLRGYPIDTIDMGHSAPPLTDAVSILDAASTELASI